jgi:hypothetical protein
MIGECIYETLVSFGSQFYSYSQYLRPEQRPGGGPYRLPLLESSDPTKRIKNKKIPGWQVKGKSATVRLNCKKKKI